MNSNAPILALPAKTKTSLPCRLLTARGGARGLGGLTVESAMACLVLHNRKPSEICEANYSSETGKAPGRMSSVWRRCNLQGLGERRASDVYGGRMCHNAAINIK